MKINYTTVSSIVHIYLKQGRTVKIPQKYRKRNFKLENQTQPSHSASVKLETEHQNTMTIPLQFAENPSLTQATPADYLTLQSPQAFTFQNIGYSPLLDIQRYQEELHQRSLYAKYLLLKNYTEMKPLTFQSGNFVPQVVSYMRKGQVQPPELGSLILPFQ